MSEITEQKIIDALRSVADPELRRSIVDLRMIRDLTVHNGKVSFTLALTIPECPLRDQLAQDARLAVQALPGVQKVEVRLGAMSAEERRAVLQSARPEAAPSANAMVQRLIAVMSGKGGVGKSLVTGMTAVALSRAGHRVGILDADVTGPSIPRLFGVQGPLHAEDERMIPAESRLGIRIVSMNLLLESEERPVIWRGPLITSAIRQFWEDADWGELDELLVDLPPGTSDAALTVMQNLPIGGIIMVTTPQALSTMVVNKAVMMARTLNAPMIGIIENMAGFVAGDTGHRYEIFGPSHANEVAQLAGAPLLARLPIRPELAAVCDSGMIEQAVMPEMDAVVARVAGISPREAVRRPSI